MVKRRRFTAKSVTKPRDAAQSGASPYVDAVGSTAIPEPLDLASPASAYIGALIQPNTVIAHVCILGNPRTAPGTQG